MVSAHGARRLANELHVALDTHALCPACLARIALVLDAADEKKIAVRITTIASSLWSCGLGCSVEAALELAVRRGVRLAPEALDELRARGAASRIFRAVVGRLAAELASETARAYEASLN
jgi:hypothetical protein